MILWICCKSLTATWPQGAARCIDNACHGENNGYDMSWPVDAKPKQEIEDCGNKVGKRLFTWHFCR